MHGYHQYTIQNRITVQQLITLEHIDMGEDYYYPEEKHDFYEFIYIKKGYLTCKMHGKNIRLEPNDFLIISPGKSHSYVKEDDSISTVFIVCFESSNAILKHFTKPLKLNKNERTIMQKILLEATRAFQFPFEKRIVPLALPVFGAQQLVKNYIEELFIVLIRDKDRNNEIKLFATKESFAKKLCENIIEYLRMNIENDISLEDICNHFYFSKNYINGTFKSVTNYTIMQYYNKLKITEAKKMLREGISASEISFRLKFNNTNYFFKFFKRYTGLTPQQFLESKNKEIIE